MYKAEYEVWYTEGFEEIHHQVKFSSENLRMVYERFSTYFAQVESVVDMYDNAMGNVYLWDKEGILEKVCYYDSNTGTWS